ncbi:hypothetical protein BCR42DRAFT_394033 [Absidia repens]|uniref:DH domain-containing protein n=1 Tax=Absidia repens TaxID=90262 RepID=A0A1X2IC30_9FUNG|nr:hypothetical protein BCR42DRAFT_394033 [Absidia repens]
MATIDAPVLNDSITNKQATQSNSLYHSCRYVLQAISTIHRLQPYLTISDPMTATTPMSILWHFCRQGSSLCILYNTLRPGAPIPDDQSSTSSSTNVRKPKAYVYDFLLACRDQLQFCPDSLFTLKDLFEDDTNGFVRVVNIVKRVVDKMKSEGIIVVPSLDRDSDPPIPKDNRDKIVIELLKTERKYVQDLEILQHYMDEARAKEILPPDTLHELFGNLNALVDHQRKFLVEIEDQVHRAPESQRFGQLFISNEKPFAVYEPFCANFQTAQNLVNRETQALEKLSYLLSATFELPSILIKPVQRICKYPLLMKELVKTTPSHWPFYDETKQGLDAIQRVAAKVNETSRLQENLTTLQLLKERVDDWSPSDIDGFGALLLHDKFMVFRGDPGRELVVYLFEKCLFVCREEKDKDGTSNKKAQKKTKKSIGGSSMAEGSTSGGQPAHARLNVRGRILISRMVQVVDSSQDGTSSLELFWSEKYVQPGQNFHLDSFTLKCRHPEQLQLWESSLNDLIKQSKTSQIHHHHHHHPVDAHPSTLAGSPQLLSPSTTTPHFLSRLDSNASDSNYSNKEYDGHRLWDNHSIGQQSQPPLLRQHSHNAAYDMTLQQFPHSVRISPSHYSASPSACSSPNRLEVHHGSDYLHSIPTTELFTQHLLDEQNNDNQDDDLDDDYDTYSPVIHTPQTPRSCTYMPQKQQQQQQQYHHNHHHALEKQLPAIMPNNNDSVPFRLRSQSSPNIHPSQNGHPEDPSPPLPTHSYHLSHNQHPYQHSGIVKFGKRKSNDDQNASNCHPILDTTTSATNVGPSHHHHYYHPNAQQPQDALSVGSSSSPASASAHAATIKLKVYHTGSIYALVIPLTIDYPELIDRIERKMKCHSTVANLNHLIVSRLKYPDEEGDLTRLSCNDDLQMAFDLHAPKCSLNLYIS